MNKEGTPSTRQVFPIGFSRRNTHIFYSSLIIYLLLFYSLLFSHISPHIQHFPPPLFSHISHHILLFLDRLLPSRLLPISPLIFLHFSLLFTTTSSSSLLLLLPSSYFPDYLPPLVSSPFSISIFS